MTFPPVQAVKPGIVHLGITDFHRGHQAHFINEILGSNEAMVQNGADGSGEKWMLENVGILMMTSDDIIINDDKEIL